MGIHWDLELHPDVEHDYDESGAIIGTRVDDFPNGGVRLDCYNREDGFAYFEVKDYTGPGGTSTPLTGIGLLNAQECRTIARKLREAAHFLEGR